MTGTCKFEPPDQVGAVSDRNGLTLLSSNRVEDITYRIQGTPGAPDYIETSMVTTRVNVKGREQQVTTEIAISNIGAYVRKNGKIVSQNITDAQRGIGATLSALGVTCESATGQPVLPQDVRLSEPYLKTILNSGPVPMFKR